MPPPTTATRTAPRPVPPSAPSLTRHPSSSPPAARPPARALPSRPVPGTETAQSSRNQLNTVTAAPCAARVLPLPFPESQSPVPSCQPPVPYVQYEFIEKQLEGDIGVELFHRTSRGVRLTEAGRLLLEETRRIFSQLDQTVDFVRRIGAGHIGSLALGFLPSVAHGVLPGVLRGFRERLPSVELSLQEMGPDDQVR
ncbi:MAG TPA: LysR substrate-binding domain-containing protein [Rubrobacter sp.]|nr:LysR substrate-binding domain-containing protein [Rubrobacter sp.]